MRLYSAVKHSLHKLNRCDFTLLPNAKQPESGSSRPVRLKINRSQAGKERRPAPTLQLRDCGHQVNDVHELLRRLDGVNLLDDDSLTLDSKLGAEEALDPVAKAIAMLVDADHFEGACTLLRWLQPLARIDLVERCPDHIKKLVACNDAKVRKAVDLAQVSAARAALTRQPQDLAQFFKLLAYCSPTAQEHSVALFPPLTTDMLRGLDDHVLVDALNLTLARIRKMDTDCCLTELVILLSVADDLEGSDVPRAAVMKSVLWLALDPNGVPDPVLSRKLEELQSRVRIPALTPELLNSVSAELRPEVAGVAQMREAGSRNLNEGLAPQPALASLLDEIDFKAAMRTLDLKNAAGLIRDSTNDAFRADASGKLLVAASLRLKELGIHVLEQKIEFRDAEAAKQQASVAREMAVLLAMAGKPSLTRSAESILSLVDSEPGALIRGVLEGLGVPHHGDLRRQICNALPTLCDAGHSSELNLILKTKLGEGLVAQAVVDHLSQSELSDDTVVSVFKTLAHRVDLRTTDLFQLISPEVLKTRHLRILADQRWAGLSERLVKLELAQSSLNECTQDLGEWEPGWRLLLLPCLDPTFNEQEGIFAVLSAKAIDAAAADRRGGVSEGIYMAALDGRLQRTLVRMLDISVTGKPLLSEGARLNVMSAIVSSTDLAKRTLAWAGDTDRPISKGDKVRVYKGMANALINLLSPPGFNGLPVNHSVADVAAVLWDAVPPSGREAYERKLKKLRVSIEKRWEKIREKRNEKEDLGFIIASLETDKKEEERMRKHLEIENDRDELRRILVDLLGDIERGSPGKMKALMSKEAWGEFQSAIKLRRWETARSAGWPQPSAP